MRYSGLTGGEPTALTRGYAFSISPDGKFIAYNFLDEKAASVRLAIIPFDGGEPVKMLDLAGAVWAPDGRGFVRVDNRGGADNIWEWPMDGGKPRPLTDFTSERIFDFAFSRDGKHLALHRGTVSTDVVLIKIFR